MLIFDSFTICGKKRNDSRIQFDISKIACTSCPTCEDRFPLGRIFRAGQNFLLFEDRLAEGMRQKTKEIYRFGWKILHGEKSDHFF